MLDNMTAVSYINKSGGTKSASLTNLALQLMNWCEERGIYVQSFHVPGVLNDIADTESRGGQNAGDWRLAPSNFQSIAETWNLEVDLFASHWNAQLTTFVSWLPQPEAWRTNAFSFSWKNLKGYCFPPFNQVGKCLQKVLEEQAELVLICPFWPSQPWFAMLLELASDVPIVLRPSPDLLTAADGSTHPLIAANNM